MTEFVRVRDKETGHEYSVPKRLAEGLKGEAISILEKDALDANGRPAPAKTRPRELDPKTEQASASGEGDPAQPVSAEMTPPTATPATVAGNKSKAGDQK